MITYRYALKKHQGKKESNKTGKKGSKRAIHTISISALENEGDIIRLLRFHAPSNVNIFKTELKESMSWFW